VEICGNRLTGFAVQACSACAGDYEDPDRTAGEEFEDLLEEPEEIAMESQVVEQPPVRRSIYQKKQEYKS
jgi:hypothetical protein